MSESSKNVLPQVRCPHGYLAKLVPAVRPANDDAAGRWLQGTCNVGEGKEACKVGGWTGCAFRE